MGGQDVVHFCGGLTAVLHACGVAIHKALPEAAPLSSTCSITQQARVSNASQSQLKSAQVDVSSNDANVMHRGTASMVMPEQHQASLKTKHEADGDQLQPARHTEQVGIAIFVVNIRVHIPWLCTMWMALCIT